MERTLTSLETKALSLKVGEKIKEFLVCAVCKDEQPGVEYSNIDAIKFREDKDSAKEKKRKLKQEFFGDDVKILEIQVKVIE